MASENQELTHGKDVWVEQGLTSTSIQKNYQMAQYLSDNKLVPAKFRKNPEIIFRVIQMGRELGIPDQMALEVIDDIDGSLTLSKNGKLAMLKRAGIDILYPQDRNFVAIDKYGKTVHEYDSPDGFERVDAFTEVIFRYKSELDGSIIEQPYRAYWSDVVKAGLNKKDNWTRMPRKMLQAEAVRNGAMAIRPDLVFMYDTSEMSDIKNKEPYQDVDYEQQN